MRVKILMFIAAALLIAIPAFGATLADENAAKDLTNKIMAKISSGDSDGGFNLMKSYIPLSGTEIDSAAVQTKAQLEQFGQRFGKSTGYEFVDSKKMGDSLLRLRYIQKMENTALVWVFIYYKPANAWMLNNFRWEDKVGYLFETN